MKTYKKWQKANINLDIYLGEIPCEIDEELYHYIGETVAPTYCGGGFVQLGEAERSEGEYPDTTDYYMTCSYTFGKFYYLGILPEFKQ